MTFSSHGGSPWDGKFYVEFALAMERGCAYLSRNHSYMVFDTLFAFDSRDHHPGPLHVERREGLRVTWLP